MNNFFQDILSNINIYYDQFVGLLPRLGLGFLIFFVLYRIAIRVNTSLYHQLSKQMDDPLLARFLARIAKVIIIFIALMVFMNIVGLTHLATGLITGASVSAIVIGFAFKDIAENFLAGIMLAFHRPFRIGDTVELTGNKGSVVSLHLRTTHIKTADGRDIYIPNASIVKNPLVNYTIDGFIRQNFTVGLNTGSDVNKAIEIIEKELLTVPGIIKEDKAAPAVTISKVNPSNIELDIYYWLDTFNKDYSGRLIRTEAITKTLDALKAAGY
ncbi:MAG: small conductance mechanosensitive channel [Nonlabens sp.]|jgi:small conductance mechanosensitive channel